MFLPFDFRHLSALDHRGHCVDENQEIQDKKRPYVKKPLNAFMLFMKEQRAKVVQEGTLKESAAINQILGRKVSTAFALCSINGSRQKAIQQAIQRAIQQATQRARKKVKKEWERQR